MGTLTLQSYWIIRGMAGAGGAPVNRRPMPDLARIALDAAGLVLGLAALASAALWMEPLP